MSRAKTFRRELDKAYYRRTAWLRTVVDEPKRGRPLSFTRKHREQVIENLQALASEKLAGKLAREVFDEGVHARRQWHVRRSKGFGVAEKKRAFNEWFDREIGHKNCLYVFWNGKKCIYVGKTTRGGVRPSSHFEKFWFTSVRRIDIYTTRGTRSLPAMECVAVHRFQPTRNKVRAAAQKWTRKCPLCAIRRGIKNELRSIFRFK